MAGDLQLRVAMNEDSAGISHENSGRVDEDADEAAQNHSPQSTGSQRGHPAGEESETGLPEGGLIGSSDAFKGGEGLLYQAKKPINIPKLNVDPDHLHVRQNMGNQQRPIVSFSARHPDEWELERDEVRPMPPGALGKLLEVNRIRGHTTERAAYRSFERRVASLIPDPNLRVQTYYDESIMPRYAKGVTPRSEPQIHGTSPLEIIFEFFAGRQQPGTAGLSLDTHFDKISAQNLSMSFPELLRFVQIMFHRNKFTLQEVQWMLRKAKSAPYGLEEGNWHGDISGEQTSLNFVEWLTCVVRLSLVSYGTQGLTPEECIDEIARDMQLHSQKLVKDRIARIARTQAGFGAWKDDATPREIFQSLAINLKRGKPLDDFMLTNHQMLKLQHRLLASSRSRENASWSAFDGPYISMVVPATPKGKFHRFQVIVQNKASNVFNVSFRLDGLPFMEASHTPSKSFCASGLDCICDLRAYCPHLGEFQGDIEVTDLKGHNVLHRVPVYLRVISGGSTRYLVERSVGPGNPIHKTLKAGSLTHRIFTNRDDPVLNRSMTSPTGRNMFVATTQDRLTKSAAALIMPLSVRDAKSNVGTLPLHPSARKGIKSPSRKSMRSMTPKSRDPLDINFTPSSSRIHSPSNITRTTSGTLTGPQSWLNGIALKSGTAFRLSA